MVFHRSGRSVAHNVPSRPVIVSLKRLPFYVKKNSSSQSTSLLVFHLKDYFTCLEILRKLGDDRNRRPVESICNHPWHYSLHSMNQKEISIFTIYSFEICWWVSDLQGWNCCWDSAQKMRVICPRNGWPGCKSYRTGNWISDRQNLDCPATPKSLPSGGKSE